MYCNFVFVTNSADEDRKVDNDGEEGNSSERLAYRARASVCPSVRPSVCMVINNTARGQKADSKKTDGTKKALHKSPLAERVVVSLFKGWFKTH